MIGPYPARSAEKQIWSELFTNPATVHANGGVITGGAVPNHGLPLNGVDQYSTHAISAGLLARPEISFEFKATPDFASDDGVQHYFFATGGAVDLYVNKRSDDRIQIRLGGVTIAYIAHATYSAYWLVDKENTFIVSSNGATTDAWLNGVQVLTAHAVAWAVKFSTSITIGAYPGGAVPFSGTIHHLKIRSRLLTQLDATAIQSNSLYTYPNRASVYLPFDVATEIGGLKQTLDRSPHGRVCLLGDGVTAASIPDFENPGFRCDGANQYMEILDGSFLYEDSLTLVSVFHPDYGEITPAHKFLFDDSTGLKYSLLKLSSGGLQFYGGGGALFTASWAAYGPHWRVNGINVLIVAMGPVTATMTLNGFVVASTAPSYTKEAVSSMNLWRRANDTQLHSGKGDGFMAFPFALSPIQADDLTLALGAIQ